jgi:hypothetical protein
MENLSSTKGQRFAFFFFFANYAWPVLDNRTVGFGMAYRRQIPASCAAKQLNRWNIFSSAAASVRRCGITGAGNST